MGFFECTEDLHTPLPLSLLLLRLWLQFPYPTASAERPLWFRHQHVWEPCCLGTFFLLVGHDALPFLRKSDAHKKHVFFLFGT